MRHYWEDREDQGRRGRKCWAVYVVVGLDRPPGVGWLSERVLWAVAAKLLRLRLVVLVVLEMEA
jgi:hypothetical protein